MPTARASTRRNSSAPRRRRCTKPMSTEARLCGPLRHQPVAASAVVGRRGSSWRPGSRPCCGRRRGCRRRCRHSTWRASKSESRARSTLVRLVGLGQVEAGQRGVERRGRSTTRPPPRRRSTAPGSRTRPRRGAHQTRPTTTSAARSRLSQRKRRGGGARSGRSPGRLDRERDLVEDLGGDRLELTGVAGAVAAEQAGRLAGRARRGRGAAARPPRPPSTARRARPRRRRP